MHVDKFLQQGFLNNMRMGMAQIASMERADAIHLAAHVLSVTDSIQWNLRALPPDSPRSIEAERRHKHAEYLACLADGRMTQAQVQEALLIDDAADAFIREGKVDNITQGIECIQRMDKERAVAVAARVMSIAYNFEKRLRIFSDGAEKISAAKQTRKNAEYLFGVADGSIAPPAHDAEQSVSVTLGRSHPARRASTGGPSM